MTEKEIYDKFFADEEYDLENAPSELYSYRSGWNTALKRASIVIRNEIRPQGEWTPVSKCWPAFSGLYLVSVDDLVTVANFTGAYFINKRGHMLNVFAWQQLPEPYKN